MKILLFFVTALTFSSSNFCLNTYQFKLFPVGMVNDQIVAIDAQISRTERFHEKQGFEEISWHINTYVAIYDKKQRLISKTKIEYKLVDHNEYKEELQLLYTKGLSFIQKKYPNLNYFKPKEISFCEFQNKCKWVESRYDAKNDANYLSYKNQEYPITIFNDSNYYGFQESAFFSNRISGYAVSSVRVFTLGDLELIVAHLENGHELSMGWITHNPKKRSKNSNEVLIYKQEYTPNIEFSNINTAIYEEPLLHHGYGVDLFLIHLNSEK